MVDEMSSYGVSELFGKILRSGSKMGKKRDSEDLDASRKRVKMRDLQSILQSEGNATYVPETSKMEDTEELLEIIETQGSQTVDVNACQCADARLLERAPKSLSKVYGSPSLDLNNDLCADENSGYNNDVVSLGDSKKLAADELDHDSLGGPPMHLKGEEVTSSTTHDFFAYKPQNSLQTKDTTEKDPLRTWKEIKENGFMSVSYGGKPPPPPVVPKQRGRKSKIEALKQKLEHAKKEQIDRFAKIAAPSGLLKGLNPGIINHVRNSKQVHSIIQALVRSEEQESGDHSSQMNSANVDQPEKEVILENVCSSVVSGSSLFYGIGSLGSLSECLQPPENCSLHIGTSLFNGGRSISAHTYCSEDDQLALKLGSSKMVSVSTSCLSNDESSCVETLSVEAATVASQWLHLLQQDIKGRLAALRCSKKRVGVVITHELPFLLAKEFESNHENDLSITKDPSSSRSMKSAAELHKAHWNKLFSRLGTSLSEEEKQLECWLNEVDRMLQLSDQGLQHAQWNKAFQMQCFGAFNNDFRSKIMDPEKELTVRAAAASIYSTGNYVSSRENVSCY